MDSKAQAPMKKGQMRSRPRDVDATRISGGDDGREMFEPAPQEQTRSGFCHDIREPDSSAVVATTGSPENKNPYRVSVK